MLKDSRVMDQLFDWRLFTLACSHPVFVMVDISLDVFLVQGRIGIRYHRAEFIAIEVKFLPGVFFILLNTF